MANQWWKEHGQGNKVAEADPAFSGGHPPVADSVADPAAPHVPLDPAANPSPSTAKIEIGFQPSDDAGMLTAVPVGGTANYPLTPDGTSVPAWSSSSPGLVVTPVGDPMTGLKAVVRHGTPPEVIIGATVTVSYQLAGNVTVEGVSKPIDVVKGGHKGWKVVSRTAGK
jgi:hypothetical protein